MSVMHFPRPSSPAESAPETLVSWEPPPWTNSVSTDEGYIRYSRKFGEVPVQFDSMPLCVEISQYDNLNFAPGSTSVTREPAQLSLYGHVLTSAQARDVIQMLETALAFVE